MHGKRNLFVRIVGAVHMKLQRCSREINWSVKKRRDTEKEIKEKVTLLKLLQNRARTKEIEAINQLVKEISIFLEHEDIKWRQRAKSNWYELRDINTKFFHTCASQRKKKNWN